MHTYHTPHTTPHTITIYHSTRPPARIRAYAYAHEHTQAHLLSTVPSLTMTSDSITSCSRSSGDAKWLLLLLLLLLQLLMQPPIPLLAPKDRMRAAATSSTGTMPRHDCWPCDKLPPDCWSISLLLLLSSAAAAAAAAALVDALATRCACEEVGASSRVSSRATTDLQWVWVENKQASRREGGEWECGNLGMRVECGRVEWECRSTGGV